MNLLPYIISMKWYVTNGGWILFFEFQIAIYVFEFVFLLFGVSADASTAKIRSTQLIHADVGTLNALLQTHLYFFRRKNNPYI